MKENVTWFIEATSEPVDRDLAELSEEISNGVTVMFDVLCVNKGGRLVHVPRLYKVPATIKDRVYTRRDDFNRFVIYRSQDDNLPRGYFEWTSPLPNLKIRVIKGSSILRRHRRHIAARFATVH